MTVRQDSVFLGSDFEVGPGPKFHVYLVPKAPIRTSGDLSGQMFVDLGRLRAFKGSQRYAIPAGLDLAKFQSVIVWCEQFSVLISPADLAPKRQRRALPADFSEESIELIGLRPAREVGAQIGRHRQRLAAMPAACQIWPRSMPMSRSMRSSRLASVCMARRAASSGADRLARAAEAPSAGPPQGACARARWRRRPRTGPPGARRPNRSGR